MSTLNQRFVASPAMAAAANLALQLEGDSSKPPLDMVLRCLGLVYLEGVLYVGSAPGKNNHLAYHDGDLSRTPTKEIRVAE